MAPPTAIQGTKYPKTLVQTPDREASQTLPRAKAKNEKATMAEESEEEAAAMEDMTLRGMVAVAKRVDRQTDWSMVFSFGTDMLLAGVFGRDKAWELNLK